MRTLLATICCACAALAGSPACAGISWLTDGEGVSQVVSNRSGRVAAISGVQTLAATGDGGAWAMSVSRLLRISRSGSVDAEIDLAGAGYGRAVTLAIDPYDASAWITTDAGLLLHYSKDGALARGTSLPAVANAAAIALDQTPWLLVNGELLRLSPHGEPLMLADEGRIPNGPSTGFAVDSLRKQLWLAGPGGLQRIQFDDHPAVTAVGAVSEPPRAMALDFRSGDVWVVVDARLLAIDAAANVRLAVELPVLRNDTAVLLEYDSAAGSMLLQTAGNYVRISADGTIVEASVLPDGWRAGSPPPFRVEPALALVRPPSGGATYEPSPELTFRLGATCNGTPCDAPAGYLDGARVLAKINGADMPDVTVRTPSETTIAVPTLPLERGVNRVTARAVDRFGHDVELAATITLLERDASSHAQQKRPGTGSEPFNAILKAPNKPPSIALTAPSAGSNFTAGATIALAATATDADGTVTKVEFYRGGSTLIGTATAAPYQVSWQNVPAGSYALTAKAYDNKNATATSAPVAVVVTNNQLPVIALTAPAQGAFYAAGAPISLAAAAGDSDGTVANVEFFDRSVSIGVASSAPFAITWTGAAAGIHAIVARATDDKGGIGVSQSIDIVVGQPPIVVVRNPLACSSVDGPLDLVLVADAVSTTGTIARVEFFDGGQFIGTSYSAPWHVTVTAATPGSHTITARAIDDHDLVTTSRPAVITVQTANQPPSVSLTSPAEGATYPLGSTVSLTASASDSDGTVSAVEYRIGSGTGPLIGRSTTAPYPVWWTNMSAGSYTVIAIAFDDRNGTRTSAPVHITIQANRPPTVALTAPVASATYTAPANIVVAASANDSDGSIAKVEFYAGSTLIGSSTTAPYTVAWNAVDAGAFLVTAKATDNLGLVAASSAVPVTVVNNAPPTVALAAPSPGGPYFAPATITLTATASDGDGSIARVDFQADGMLIGSATATPYSIIWDNVADGSHSVTARAVDDRGGVTVTDPLSVTVNADATILPFAGLDGSTVDDDSAVVGGTITAPPNSGVLVNGVLAQLEANGRFHANGVPLIPGTNAITIKVVSQDGQVATKAITMSSNGPAPFAVLATPTEGLAPLQVTYQIENRADRAFQRLAFDYNDDGIVDFTATASQFVDGVFTLIVTYPAGTVTTRLTVYDVDNAVIQSTARVITARTVEQQDALIKGVYDAMLERLRAGKIAMALNAISGDMQDKYGAVFTGLGANLIDEVNGLGTLQPNWYSSDHAEYFLTRDTPEGQQAFLIDFIRGQDGIWRIHAM